MERSANEANYKAGRATSSRLHHPHDLGDPYPLDDRGAGQLDEHPVFHPAIHADARGHEEIVADDLVALPKHGELGVVAANGFGDVHLDFLASLKGFIVK